MNESTLNLVEATNAEKLELALETAKSAQASAEYGQFITNNLWILIAAAMVFMMHLGFAALEAGLVQKKNVVNILFKNSMIIAIGLLFFCFCGFNLMYPDFDQNSLGVFGFSGFGIHPTSENMTSSYGNYTYLSDFTFQAMFAATGATIVSGAVAERIKLMPFLLFTIVFVALIYPIAGSWKWGLGWLENLGFYDFAGSTLVHSAGGWAALAGIILLGPREGKYTSEGVQPMKGHSMPLAVLGVFILWFGWFGFNGGSVLSADPGQVSLVFATTALAAAGGAVGSFFLSYLMFKNFDLAMVLNGILGGLVGITAGANVIGINNSILVGIIAGALIPLSVTLFDKIKLDDPVGATSVHLVCGIWGTLAVSIFGNVKDYGSLLAQLVGIGAVGIFTFSCSFLVFFIIKKCVGIRVNKVEEARGLDVEEHQLLAYS